jgi:ferric-dicitrate binding protein FerR (iron transport regulator)
VRKEAQAGTFAVREGSLKITFRKTGKTITLDEGEAVDYSADQKRFEKRKAKKTEMRAMKQIDDIKLSDN